MNMDTKGSAKQAQADETQQILAAVVESSDDAIIVRGMDGLITYWNLGAERLYGYTAREAVGRPPSFLQPPGQREQLPDFPQRVQRGEHVDPYEGVRLTKDGRLIEVWLNLFPVNDAAGNLIAVASIARDLTEHKRAEEALQEAREQYQAIINTASDAFVSIDAGGLIIDWNEAAAAVFGWRREEAVGRSMADLIMPPRYRERHLAGLQHFLSTGEGPVLNQRLELAALHRDGREFPVEITIWPVQRGNGCTFNAFIRDITALKQAAEDRERLAAAAERERATLASVMMSMSDGLLLLDGAGLVRYCNPRAGELLGIDPAAATGRPAEEIQARMERAFTDPEGVRLAWRQAVAQLHDHPTFDVSLAGQPSRDLAVQLFDIAGEQSVGVLLRDVTIERELQRTKDELVSVVSHELRTPLASLVGFAELLLTREYGEARRRQYLSVIREEGQRLTSLINDFLDLQRMESGRQNLVLVPTSLRLLVEKAAANAGDDPERPVVLDVPEQLPMVRADGDRVLQVLANLLSNARKYSPSGGQTVLSARPKDGVVEVCVSDQGLGLPSDALPRLFEKFYRVDNSDRREITGTGLGLAICRQIVTGHGGRIWAESAGVGRGSRFSFTLPLAETSTGQGDVLIVEDESGFTRLLSAELAARGLSAIWTATGEDALVRLRQTRPRAIVLDLILPGLSGEEVLARLRGIDKDVPVIVVTVKDLSPRESRSLDRLGVLGVLRKAPDAAARAAATITHALDQAGGVSEGKQQS